VVESKASPAACVTLIDTFPPAAPAGLAAVGTEGAINLIWSAGSEADLAGYLVLRSEGGGEPAALTTEPVKPATYRDDNVKPGVRYSYVVVGVDTAGNRSAPSNRVEDAAR
jgi:hypothetical protein